MIEKMLATMVEQQAQIGVCDMEYLYDDGRVEFASGGEFAVGDVKTHPELIRMNNSACNKLFARSLFQDIEFPVGKWYEDLATIPMICFNAERIVKVNERFMFIISGQVRSRTAQILKYLISIKRFSVLLNI